MQFWLMLPAPEADPDPADRSADEVFDPDVEPEAPAEPVEPEPVEPDAVAPVPLEPERVEPEPLAPAPVPIEPDDPDMLEFMDPAPPAHEASTSVPE